MRVLHIDDAEDYRKTIAGLIRTWFKDSYQLTSEPDFNKVLTQLESSAFGAPAYDVVLLDLADGNDLDRAGLRILREIKSRLFVEVIILSGHSGTPALEKELGPFVKVIDKTKFDLLRNALAQLPSSKALKVRDRMTHEVVNLLRQEQAAFLWALAENDVELLNSADTDQLASNLARRLAVKITMPLAESEAHHFFIRPPFDTPRLLGGDLLKGTVVVPSPQTEHLGRTWHHNGYWTVVTASCDLERGDERQVTLAATRPLAESPQYQKWATDPIKYHQKLVEFMQNRSSMHCHVLPKWFDIPALVVDFESTVSVPSDMLDKLFTLKMKRRHTSLTAPEQGELAAMLAKGLDVERIASLNSPFGEHLTSRYGYKYGRIGVATFKAGPMVDDLRNLLS